MKHNLHPKVLEAKRKAAAINYRSLNVSETGELVDTGSLLERRVVAGYGIIWGRRNSHMEKHLKGSWTKTIREHGPASNSHFKIQLMGVNHDWANPLAPLAVLEERDLGLYFETHPIPEGEYENNALTKIRDGRINNFSIGFIPVWDKVEYDDSDDSIVIAESQGLEISPVTIPSDKGTFVVRNLHGLDQDALDEMVEDFINELPRRNRVEARHLFARHKALIANQPPSANTRSTVKPPAAAGRVSLEYIVNNLKF